MPRSVITILGGGFSGSALAAHLARLPGSYCGDVHVVEPRPVLGRGLAYSADRPEYLLNVRARALSLLADEPAHFTEWLGRNEPAADAQAFCPRQLYGRYVQEMTQVLLPAPAANGLRFHWHQTHASAVLPAAAGQAAAVELVSGTQLVSDAVVLALGNFPLLPPARSTDDRYLSHPGFHGSPWETGALRNIAIHDSVLLIGSGLTAVDVVLGLRAQGHQGSIMVVSGHGRWPTPHIAAQPAYPEFYTRCLRGLTSVSSVLRAVRQEIREAAAADIDWRPVLDSLRPDLGRIWLAWPQAEQSRFLRHLASFWTTVRHRSPPQNVAVLEEMRRSGQLTQHVGRVQHIEPLGEALRVQARHGSHTSTLTAQHVIACTGPLLDYTRIQDPLIVQMRQAGLLQPDPLRLGLLTDAHGALIQADKTTSSVLFTLGASRRPQSFESTAVPELRQQAAELAQYLAARLQQA
ncbi:FAD/NAD(P)-binding protein [Hymenobacter guriensis]|uniref:FAD/NAD(P)-binding protein n=1 Tax=Hymenobacter guriensis TaxID=2793065 RepID=A0ABS0L599_9BACT|nr:FAD/NAD(P)-binding protein [Hymenobacter guriensis]MBG8555288.1 FAD/NAD(P)-binding protein [Hymenobacter guriensis]